MIAATSATATILIGRCGQRTTATRSLDFQSLWDCVISAHIYGWALDLDQPCAKKGPSLGRHNPQLKPQRRPGGVLGGPRGLPFAGAPTGAGPWWLGSHTQNRALRSFPTVWG